MRRMLFLGLILCGLSFSAESLAHAHLESSTPANNAQLSAPPKSLVLNFSEAAQLAVLKLMSGGKQIAVPLDKSAKPSQTFALKLPELAPGSYTVQWTALAADDGHITKGTFAFSIAP